MHHKALIILLVVALLFGVWWFFIKKKECNDISCGTDTEGFKPLSSNMEVLTIDPVRDQSYFTKTNDLMSSFGDKTNLEASQSNAAYFGII